MALATRFLQLRALLVVPSVEWRSHLLHVQMLLLTYSILRVRCSKAADAATITASICRLPCCVAKWYKIGIDHMSQWGAHSIVVIVQKIFSS